MQKIDGNFSGKDILSISQFTPSDIQKLFTYSDVIRNKIEAGEHIDVLRGYIMASLFYEPSTRT